MNIQAIRLFLHVTRLGSLAAGAKALNMSPSAASRLLAGLERTTGLKLFSREGHSLRPTAEGAQYFQECHRVLVAVDELPHVARRLAGGGHPRLKLICGARLAASLMIPAIGGFVRRSPDVEIDFELTQAHDIDRIISGRFDVGIGAMLPKTLTTVDFAPLLDTPIVAIMRRDHSLARRNFVHAAELATHRLVATPAGPLRDDLELLFHSAGAKLSPQFTANSVEHGCRLLLEIGAVMICDPLAAMAIDPDLFALVPLRPARMMRTSIYTPLLRPQSRLVEAFKECLREEARAIEDKMAALLGRSGTKRRSGRNSAR
jgi:DNA-binding transcriptional LysR family regulator